jgi:hypothetical protein
MADTVFNTGQGQQIYFFFAKNPKLFLEPTHPPTEWVQVDAAIVSKRREREVDNSRPSSAEVENDRSFTPAPLMPTARTRKFLPFTFAFLYTFHNKVA